jgi:hypothetical protein
MIALRGGLSFSTKAKASVPGAFQSALIDETRLPFVKYILGQTWRRFQEGKATTEERKRVIEALKTFLPRRTTQVDALDAARSALDKQSVLGGIRKGPGVPKSPAELLARLKDDVMEYYSLEESQYEHIVKEILRTLSEGGENGQGEDPLKVDTMEAGSLANNPTMSAEQQAEIARIMNEIANR